MAYRGALTVNRVGRPRRKPISRAVHSWKTSGIPVRPLARRRWQWIPRTRSTRTRNVRHAVTRACAQEHPRSRVGRKGGQRYASHPSEPRQRRDHRRDRAWSIHQKPRSTMLRPTPGKNRIPTSKQVHELEKVSATGPDVTVTAQFSDLTGTAYLGQCSYKDEADQVRWLLQPDGRRSHRGTPAAHRDRVRGDPPTLTQKGHRNAWSAAEGELPSALEDYR